MKKKFTRILMLLAVAVTMGAIQSCKDANEDLYNQATLQAIADNASLQEALETQIKNLQTQLDQYKEAMAKLSTCTCDKTLPQTVASMQATIEDLQKQINTKASAADVASMQTIIDNYTTEVNNLKSSVSTINNYITTTAVSKSELQDAIDLLEKEIKAAGKSCDCDLTEILDRLSKVEQAAIDAKAKADAAMDKALEAAAAAAAAQTAANNAATAAANAATAAANAKVAADEAKQAAADAKAIADAANTLAQANKTAIDKNTSDIATNTSNIATNTSNISTNTTNIATNATNIKNIQLQLVTMSDSLKTAYETAADAKAKAETNKLLIDSLAKVTKSTETALASLTTTVTNLGNKVTQIESQVTTNKTNIENLQKDVTGLKSDVTALYNKVDSLGDEIDDLKEEIIKLYAYSDANLEKAKAYTDLEIALLKANFAEDINDLNDKYDDLKDQVDQNTIDITTLKGNVAQNTSDITNIKSQITTILGDITGIKSDITDLKDNDSKLNARIDSVVSKFNDYKTITDGHISILGDSIYQNYEEILKLQTRVTAIENSYVTTTTFTATVNDLTSKINANTTEIASVKDAYQKADDVLQGEIDALTTDLTALTERVKKNEDAIDAITGQLDIINEMLAKQVTGIIIQGTKNPLFGSITAPFGIQSNIVLAYYGYPENKVEFPTSRTGNYVHPDEALTAADMNMLNGVDVFESSTSDPLMFENGYAGKVYVTINPNTANLEGLRLDIVNSQDEVSPIKLTGLQKSDETLMFGYSRAADNGFYEADATVTADQILNVKHPSLDASKIKDAISEIAKNRTGADMSSVATDLYDAVKGFKLERSGLKCSYTENSKEHSVYSSYDLAATSFQPLSLTTFKDLNVVTIPGYEKANTLLDKIASKLKDEVHVVAKEVTDSTLADMVGNLTIKDIEIKDLTEAQLALFKVDIDTTVYFDGMTYTLDLHQDQQVNLNFTIENVETTIPSQTVTIPTISVTTKTNSEDGTGKLLVPVKNDYGVQVGTAEVNLDDVKVTASASVVGGYDITIQGQKVYSNVPVNKTVTIPVDITKKLFFGSYTLDSKGNYVYVGQGNGDASSIHLWITRDLSDAATSLWGSAQSALGDVNDMLDDLRDIVDEVNKLVDKVNNYEDKINNNVDKYIDKVKDYLEKINSKATSLINSAHSRLQPVMVVSTGNGLKRLSGSKNYPTVLNSNVVSFYPTSWTLETLVPLARKHVAVTNVFKGTSSAQGGNADCKARLETANSHPNLNKVIDGNIRGIGADRFVPGYVYEIAYSALDFHGKIATRKYYFTIVK